MLRKEYGDDVFPLLNPFPEKEYGDDVFPLLNPFPEKEYGIKRERRVPFPLS